jgi:hypothetical protein
MDSADPAGDDDALDAADVARVGDVVDDAIRIVAPQPRSIRVRVPADMINDLARSVLAPFESSMQQMLTNAFEGSRLQLEAFTQDLAKTVFEDQRVMINSMLQDIAESIVEPVRGTMLRQIQPQVFAPVASLLESVTASLGTIEVGAIFSDEMMQALQDFAEAARAESPADDVELEPLTLQGIAQAVAAYAAIIAMVRGTSVGDRPQVVVDLLLGVIVFCLLQLADDERKRRG